MNRLQDEALTDYLVNLLNSVYGRLSVANSLHSANCWVRLASYREGCGEGIVLVWALIHIQLAGETYDTSNAVVKACSYCRRDIVNAQMTPYTANWWSKFIAPVLVRLQ